MGMKQSWVRRCEHIVLRLVSLGFSLASAYAIRLFFAPLDAVDRLESVITWTIAVGFGVLGYFVSRGLVHRMMSGERIRVYVPICGVVELVDIACNYTLAAEVVHRASWLVSVPVEQRDFLTAITYVVLSVIPLVSLLLAVVDMDLERSKMGVAVSRVAATPAGRAQPAVPRLGTNGAVGAAALGRQPVTPRVADDTQRVAQSAQQQQAKRAGVWGALQRQREQEPVTQAHGVPVSPRDLLYDPAKRAADMMVADIP